MVDSGSEDESIPFIKITLKSTANSQVLEVKENSTIKKVKEKLSNEINQSAEKICLIFSGKILKDHDRLTTYNIKDGMSIHMVIRNQSQTSTPTSKPATAAPTSTATASNNAGSAPIPGLGGMNMEGARRMMNSPMFQSLLNNPEVLRNMISGSEQFQNIARQNPEIGHMLNDPEVIRQTLEMIRNPNMFNEMMRNHDQAIRNLQGIPGGEAALQRLYQDVQEPLLNSATSGGNPFVSGGNNESNTESRSQRAGVENAEALPNPWGGGSTGTSNTTNTTDTSSAADAAGLGGLPGMGNIGEMLNNPAMQEMMRNMMSNPEVLNAAFSPDMIQQARQVFGGNAPSGEDMSRLTEQFRNVLGNPEITAQMFKPRVMEALNNIRTNIEVLRQEAPGLYQQMFESLHTTMGQMTSATNTSSSTASGANQTTATDAAAGTGTPQNPLGNPNNLLQFLSQMNRSGAVGGLPADNRPPEERYRSQLDQLVNMGFTNTEANLRAIQDAHGDVNGAIDKLLNQR